MNNRSLMHTLALKTMALARPFAGRRWLRLYGVLEHRGRTSGREYRTPVVVQSAGDTFLIPIPFGESTQWVQNVLAAGGASVVWGGRTIDVTDPQVVERREAGVSFNAIERFAMARAGIDRFMRLRPTG